MNIPRKKLPDKLDLLRGTTVLGSIEVKPGAADFPWYSGAFKPSPAFEAVRGLFSQELELIRANTTDDEEKWEEWEAVHAQLNDPRLRLLSPDKAFEADGIIIHIDGAEAWWRDE